MWRVLRPDAVAVLKDERARKSLGRYFAVMGGELPARFLVCKRAEVKVDLSAGDEELWRAHDRGLREFRKLLAHIDGGKARLEDLERPEPSLLDLKVELARRILKSCHFCERRCVVDRTAGKVGVCGVSERSRIASEFIHMGEEPELVPSYTIFFNGCTFKCCFCQNYDISQDPRGGVEVSPRTLARLVEAQRHDGARNVNWVGGSPTPHLHTILETLNLCEVSVPSVWNSNFYMSLEAMKLLFGTQDVYLTDFKYADDKCALKYSKVPNFFKIVARNHRLAFADSELIVRHLVLPNHIECCTRPVLEWIAENLGSMVRVNLMDQYRPEYRAHEFEELNRRLTSDEFGRALEIAREVGLENVIT
ncbi:MAG: radical SAM protein [Candidatus Hodarchaeaceae archaeon]|nr:radical SAM protein [Candidatus Hodarchaeaceae archaeon]